MSTDRSTTAMEPAVAPDAWVDRYGDYLFRYAVSRLRDTAAAEEVVQETFLAALAALEQYNGTGSQRSWLLHILRRKIVDFVRVQARHRSYAAASGHDPAAELFDTDGKWRNRILPELTPDQHFESSELWQVVRECLTQLPAAQADVFVLSVMEGLESSQICRALNISLDNLWVRLHRARLGLAKCVSAKWFAVDESRPLVPNDQVLNEQVPVGPDELHAARHSQADGQTAENTAAGEVSRADEIEVKR